MEKSGQSINWEDTIPKILAITLKMVQAKKWFRGEQTDSYSEGKQVEDYVNEGICRYLEHPEKYDPNKGTLVYYIVFYIIRTLISNDAKSPENKTSKSLSSFQHVSEDGESISYQDALLPHVEAYFDDQIDYDSILSEIEQSVNGDAFVESIFMGLCLGLKRREIIAEFEFPEKDYDNGVRRLRTLLNSYARKYDLKNKSL